MIFPLGEYLILSLALLAVLNELRFLKTWGGLGLAWLLGLILENVLHLGNDPWHWHFSRVFVLAFFVGIAWPRTQGRKVLPIVVLALTFLGQNLFYVNEPGMFKLDQWVFGGLILLVAFLFTKDLWGMGLALAGGTLLDLGLSVFLFQGVVRHYDMPNPFFWELGVTFLVLSFGISALGPILKQDNRI